MTDARPLRDVFTDLVGAPGTTGDPAALLSDQGHEALPDELVAEAVVSYADTAPVEVAEHLAPYVAAHSVVGPEPGDEPPAGWPGLLATAPDVGIDEIVDLAEADDGVQADVPAVDFGAGAEPDFTVDEIEIELPEETEAEEISSWEPIEVPAADDLTAEAVELPVEDDDDELDEDLPG